MCDHRPMSGLRLLITTAPADAAPGLARGLLEARLIGCANLIPSVRSLYWWQGEVQDDAEVVMLMETPQSLAEEAVAALEQAHPYDVPKILVVEPQRANGPYTQWLDQVTR